MDRRLPLTILTLLLSLSLPSAFAGELSPSDAKALRDDVRALMTAYARGDADFLIERTHPSLKRLAGGDEAFQAITRDALKKQHSGGVVVISEDVGVPTRTYAAGRKKSASCHANPWYGCVKPRCAAPRSWWPCAALAVPGGRIWTARGCRTIHACFANCCQRWNPA